MDAYTGLTYLLLGAFLGTVGQGARAIVGLKKEFDEASLSNKGIKEWFDTKELVISLGIGAIAGILGAVLLLGAEINKQLFLGLIAAGYSGADFIEGIMKTSVPK